MPKRNRRGRFVKGGGRSVVRYRKHVVTRYRNRPVKHRRRGRRSSAASPTNLLKLGMAGAAIGYAVKGNLFGSGAVDMLDRIPGTKTFGRPAAVAALAWGINRYVKPHPWLRLVTAAGVVITAFKIGDAGFKVDWVGDDDVGDVGDDDIGFDDAE